MTSGGVRGGKDQFKWENVKGDKDRELFLGHSVMAPVRCVGACVGAMPAQKGPRDMKSRTG